ncbi:hypothetical protein C8R47DRAFT_1063057 [Mycena vitilis]|nr:hypothetical protein C8R47DRAFT_1063057 [Mycena vitilis]
MAVDDNEDSVSWHGIGGHCQDSIPRNALNYIDNVPSVSNNLITSYDELGRYRLLEFATQPDWRRPEEHFRGWMPTGPERGQPAEWWQDYGEGTLVEESSDGKWCIPDVPLQLMVRTLVSFRDAVEAIAENPKYDTYVHAPLEFDNNSLHQSFDTVHELQIIATHAKRSVGEMWGHLASWTSTVSGWDEGLPVPIVDKINGWRLLSRPKRGFLISLRRDWEDIDFGHLIAMGVPLFYVWGLFESTNARFGRLNPTLINGYRDACLSKGVLSLWGEEVEGLSKEFAECGRFDGFLQWKRHSASLRVQDAPRQGLDSGLILYHVKDFASWARRPLADDEDWQVLDKLYHHVVTESRQEQVTHVIFLRFHRKPRNVVLNAEYEFMDEDRVEVSASEVRERFKGRCAPKAGQEFDPETGVERSSPLAPGDSTAVRRWEEKQFLTPPPNGLGRSALQGVGVDGNANPDTTKMGRAMGPRRFGPSSDRSSERREYDSVRPMAFTTGWTRGMTRGDNAGNYQVFRPSRRQNHPMGGSTRDSPSSRLSEGGRSQAGSRSSIRRSASPQDRRGYPDRPRSPASERIAWGPAEVIQERLARRADFLDNIREWGSQFTHNAVLWRIPIEYGWDLGYLKDGYLIISEAAEIRLRMVALMTPGLRFLRHVLELALERGIPFNIALPSSVCQNYRPRVPVVHRATTKALLESTDRRLEPGSSPAQTHSRWLRLLGEITGLENARAIIGRGGAASWIVRAHGYLGLVDAFMSGPSVQVTVYHGGANDSADEDSMSLRWDELNDNDYQCLYGYVPGPIRERDTWMYPPDEMLEDISKHYYREWNPVVDDLYRRIKAEWEDRPCRGKLRNRKEWREFFHASNHGKHAPALEINSSWIQEGKERLARAFTGPWNKRKIWVINVPETFKEDF